MDTKENKKERGCALSNTLLWSLMALFVIAADQFTKYLTVRYLKPVYTYPVWPGVVSFTYVENTGAAFGMFSDKPWIHKTISTIAVTAVIAYLIVERNKPRSRWITAAAGMIIGGGIGNLIDRFVNGYVVDFIELKFVKFAVFNTADSFVCVGAAILFVCALVMEIRRDRAEKAKLKAETKA